MTTVAGTREKVHHATAKSKTAMTSATWTSGKIQHTTVKRKNCHDTNSEYKRKRPSQKTNAKKMIEHGMQNDSMTVYFGRILRIRYDSRIRIRFNQRASPSMDIVEFKNSHYEFHITAKHL